MMRRRMAQMNARMNPNMNGGMGVPAIGNQPPPQVGVPQGGPNGGMNVAGKPGTAPNQGALAAARKVKNFTSIFSILPPLLRQPWADIVHEQEE